MGCRLWGRTESDRTEVTLAVAVAVIFVVLSPRPFAFSTPLVALPLQR